MIGGLVRNRCVEPKLPIRGCDNHEFHLVGGALRPQMPHRATYSLIRVGNDYDSGQYGFSRIAVACGRRFRARYRSIVRQHSLPDIKAMRVAPLTEFYHNFASEGNASLLPSR